jgi:hypothetical protein
MANSDTVQQDGSLPAGTAVKSYSSMTKSSRRFSAHDASPLVGKSGRSSP